MDFLSIFSFRIPEKEQFQIDQLDQNSVEDAEQNAMHSLVDDQNASDSLVASGSLTGYQNASDSLTNDRNPSDLLEQNAPDYTVEGDEKLKMMQENETLKKQLERSENDKACFQS